MRNVKASPQQQTAYVVPQRRGEAAQEANKRALGDLEYGNLQVLLLFSAGGPFSDPESDCPFTVEPVTDEQSNAFDDVLVSVISQCDCDTIWSIKLPKQLHLDDGAYDLLDWFAAILRRGGLAVRDKTARLVLPASLSKEERAQWHQLCVRLSLFSESHGLAASRRLVVSAGIPNGEDSGSWRSRDNVEASKQAAELVCMMEEECGGESPYSRGELIEWIVSGTPLPDDILRLLTIRKEASLLWTHLENSDEEAAMHVLAESSHPKELAWRKSITEGYYPVHHAILHRMRELALHLVQSDRYPGILQQSAGSWGTPLSHACSRNDADLVVAFMEAGAHDYKGSVAEMHRRLVMSGDNATRKILESSTATSFFRKAADERDKKHSESSPQQTRAGRQEKRVTAGALSMLGSLLQRRQPARDLCGQVATNSLGGCESHTVLNSRLPPSKTDSRDGCDGGLPASAITNQLRASSVHCSAHDCQASTEEAWRGETVQSLPQAHFSEGQSTATARNDRVAVSRSTHKSVESRIAPAAQARAHGGERGSSTPVRRNERRVTAQSLGILRGALERAKRDNIGATSSSANALDGKSDMSRQALRETDPVNTGDHKQCTHRTLQSEVLKHLGSSVSKTS